MGSPKAHHLLCNKKLCTLVCAPIKSLPFSEACLRFSVEINGIKGHLVKMFEYDNLFARQRQIPFLFKTTNLLHRMSKIKITPIAF